jgi:septal ring factor EnvC (AmiA/AmiB activator)
MQQNINRERKPMSENQLQIIVQSSGLEPTKAQVILTKFQDYFSIAADWEQKAKMIVVTSAEQTADMAMARVGRLFLREKRIAIEKTRKELKEQALRESKAIDGLSNVLKALIEPIEDYLEKQEKFVEIKAAAEAEQKRVDDERKIEEARIAAEAAEAAERERVKQENERLKKEAEEKEKALAEERRRVDAERKAAEDKARAEREAAEAESRRKVDAERKEKERLAALLAAMVTCPFCKKQFSIT